MPQHFHQYVFLVRPLSLRSAKEPRSLQAFAPKVEWQSHCGYLQAIEVIGKVIGQVCHGAASLSHSLAAPVASLAH